MTKGGVLQVPKDGPVTAEIKNGRLLLSVGAIAAIYGVTDKTVGEWARRGMPRAGRGKYDVTQVMEWRVANDGGPEDIDRKKQKADADYKKFRAANEEVKLKATLGEYVPVADVEREVADAFRRVKTALTGIRQKVIGRVYGAYPDLALDVANVVEEEIERGLRQLAKEGKD